MIIADTGFFLALANADDLHHNAALKAFGDLNEPLITTWPVMTETSHLMLNRVGQQDLLSQIYSTRQLMTHLIWSLGRKISLFTASFALRNVSPEAELSILFIADFFEPVDDLAVESLVDRDMRHGCGTGRAVPMFFTRRNAHDISGMDDYNRPAFTLHASATGCHD